MLNAFRSRGLNQLNFLVMSAAVLVLFFFAAAPSAKAQTYDVKITGGTGTLGTGCNDAGTTGILTISGETLEFTSASGCYFGTVGFDSGFSTCNNSVDCSTLSSLTAGAGYFFQNLTSPYTNAGACNTSSACSAATQNENFVLNVGSGGITGSANTALQLGAVGNTPEDVQFNDGVLVTPEPVSFLLFGSGLLVLGVSFRKKLGLSNAAV
jgi:hypothetical protein